MSGRVSVFVIAENPSDYPGVFVVREHVLELHGEASLMTPVDPPVGTATSLQLARGLVPPGRVRFDRDPDDDPVIVEVWL